MASTPRRQRRSSAANTPGDQSVASRASASSSTKRSGVPVNIQKQLAQELESAYPIGLCPAESNSAQALLDTGKQALSKFLDQLVEEDPENNSVFGQRGDKIRDKIGDLIQWWKKKDNKEYRQRVVVKLGVKAVKLRAPKAIVEPAREAKATGNDDDDDDVSSDPTKEPPEERKPKATRKTRGSGKTSSAGQPVLGSTVTTESISAAMSDNKRFERIGNLLIGKKKICFVPRCNCF